jgi:hypothetical protein
MESCQSVERFKDDNNNKTTKKKKKKKKKTQNIAKTAKSKDIGEARNVVKVKVKVPRNRPQDQQVGVEVYL